MLASISLVCGVVTIEAKVHGCASSLLYKPLQADLLVAGHA